MEVQKEKNQGRPFLFPVILVVTFTAAILILKLIIG